MPITQPKIEKSTPEEIEAKISELMNFPELLTSELKALRDLVLEEKVKSIDLFSQISDLEFRISDAEKVSFCGFNGQFS